ncbi:hypothetical protein B296_00057222 [Ensete ventricosum]|uniref:Uncharacterized protein n=4 Tax=Musaceae TaxID=4637 RepID=A0A426XJ06_ENSVE|nr:hypothetical protein B296_00057222 [Ensete ventricosum]
MPSERVRWTVRRWPRKLGTVEGTTARRWPRKLGTVEGLWEGRRPRHSLAFSDSGTPPVVVDRAGNRRWVSRSRRTRRDGIPESAGLDARPIRRGSSFVEVLCQFAFCEVEMAVAALGDAGVVLGGGKRRFKSLYWRLRAEIRRQLAKGRESKQRFSFHYDPYSYALNFDDGCSGFLSL